MSKFLCSPKHIGVLAHAFKTAFINLDVDEVADMLARANLKAVKTRYATYRDMLPDNEGGKPMNDMEYIKACMEQALLGIEMAPIEVIKLANSFDYQCQGDKWEATQAYDNIQELIVVMACNIEGYDEAPWSV